MQDVAKYENLGSEIFIMGDLNARIGEENDFIEDNDLNAQDDYVPIPDHFEVNTNIRERKTLDNIEVSGHHKQLLNFCKVTGLKILNGRVGIDREIGNFTCHIPAGSSTVDYCLTTERNFDLVENFYEINTISDHAYLQLCLKINTSEAIETNVLEDESQIHTEDYELFSLKESYSCKYIPVEDSDQKIKD